ncbi:methyltransferase domain-containing protein [Diplogelasinospora grovesii]|uniref:Protein-lysine N-methyltransferase EFM4 n=1 Tax=Diplogelasinospora grovesii TaxID=303347 RepID=A0AAN6N8X9_9PEZI|nr:methyltransferase domain-containing protein [Diplogelasinospora grovesii]
MAGTKPAHLEPSQLGTKEYWESVYDREVLNHSSNPADEGTVWFDDSDAESRMVTFLDQHHGDDRFGLDKETASVLDLGCGNGSLLFALHDDGWESSNLLGVDYSSLSVALAKQIYRTRYLYQTGCEGEEDENDSTATQNGTDDDDDDDDQTTQTDNTNPRTEIGQRGEEEEEEQQQEEGEEKKETGEEEEEEKEEKEEGVRFQVWDVLHDPHLPSPTPHSGDDSSGWDVVLDKGTFDAVCLSGLPDVEVRYASRVRSLLRPGGIFLVTSCNWTEAELQAWFEDLPDPDTHGRLQQAGRIEYPSFSFGGVKGQTVSSICFQKS